MGRRELGRSNRSGVAANVQRDRKAGASYLQRRLSIGYNRAATLIEKMEKAGIISEANAAGKRDILVDVIDED